MEQQSRLGPFRPGPGGLPPYLAGRGSEQAIFRRLLSGLQDGLAPPREVVLHGPRGNGKTALLAWLQREAAGYPGVDVLRLTPADIPNEPRLVQRVLPTTWLQRLTPSEVSIRGITWLTGRNESAPLDEVLAARVRKKPLVLLLDEAHTLDGEVGSTLLNTSQKIGRDLPFLLVLAGTPNLRSHLNTMNVSFWNRAERRPVGRLDPSAAGEAIRQPLHGDNIDIDEDALAHVVRESHGYPYFVQLWGEALWRQATEAAEPEARRRLNRAAADAVQSAFDREKNDYCLDRYEELEKLDLLPVARTVAEAFGAQPLLNDSGLEAAVLKELGTSAGGDALTRAKEAMRDLGYVWRPEATPSWEPGIPSLMDYVREYTPAAPNP